ncbi:uncharacterized protein LOC124539636 [Vanessa cardui]|uniref:uncharacterized protein LOC124539636 n=1 Tax=Vanessa cardui TaxID=171605 RepID=UPI001F1331D0|nr:uncharacterized protein LOC124539636 [Vanessa cardui]
MKCSKVKNACKICFQSVNKKNGLQCQGACQKWAHFKCLNFTPGKIHDIKNGLIEITCPCPDCNMPTPKEKLVNPPYTCTNTKCPANKLPICTSKECPSNRNPIPKYPVPPVDIPKVSPTCTPPSPPKCNIKRNSSPPQIYTKPKQQTRVEPHNSKCPHSNCPRPASPQICKLQKPSRPCESCNSSHQLLNKPNRNVCSPKQSQSCSNISIMSTCSDNQEIKNLRAVSSDSQVNVEPDQVTLYSAIENMSKTVGELSIQLKDLMCKMNQV